MSCTYRRTELFYGSLGFRPLRGLYSGHNFRFDESGQEGPRNLWVRAGCELELLAGGIVPVFASVRIGDGKLGPK